MMNRLKLYRLLAALLLLFFVVLAVLFSINQIQPRSPSAARLDALLLQGKGTIIAQGQNITPLKHPMFNLSLETYRVEEVPLPGPTTMTVLVPGPTQVGLHVETITVDK